MNWLKKWIKYHIHKIQYGTKQSAASVPTDKSLIVRRLRGFDVKYSGVWQDPGDTGETLEAAGELEAITI